MNTLIALPIWKLFCQVGLRKFKVFISFYRGMPGFLFGYLFVDNNYHDNGATHKYYKENICLAAYSSLFLFLATIIHYYHKGNAYGSDFS